MKSFNIHYGDASIFPVVGGWLHVDCQNLPLKRGWEIANARTDRQCHPIRIQLIGIASERHFFLKFAPHPCSVPQRTLPRLPISAPRVLISLALFLVQSFALCPPLFDGTMACPRILGAKYRTSPVNFAALWPLPCARNKMNLFYWQQVCEAMLGLISRSFLAWGAQCWRYGGMSSPLFSLRGPAVAYIFAAGHPHRQNQVSRTLVQSHSPTALTFF